MLPSYRNESIDLNVTAYYSVFRPNAGKCGKNADQNNSEYGHFLRSVWCDKVFMKAF